jgi:hypothetical protein
LNIFKELLVLMKGLGKELAVYQHGAISNPEGPRLGDLKSRRV